MEERSPSNDNKNESVLLTREAKARPTPGARVPILIALLAGFASATGVLAMLVLFLMARSSDAPTFVPSVPGVVADSPAQTPIDRPVALPSAIDGALIVSGHGGPFLILATDASVEWADAGGQFHVEDGTVTIVRPTTAAVDTIEASFVGREFDLYGQDGVVCRASARELVAYNRYVSYDDPTDLENALETAGEPTLAVRLAPMRGDCATAAWAREAYLPEPMLAFWDDDEGTTTSVALAAFRELPAYREIQKQYRKETGQKGPWHEQEGFSLEYRPYSNDRVVVVSASGGGCGEFEAALTAVIRVRGAEAAVLATYDLPMRVTESADMDGDGKLDFVITEDLFDRAILSSKDNYRRKSSLSIPFVGCRC
jgi:hypothetical protein